MKIISYHREKLSPSTFATDARKIYPFDKEKDNFSSAMVAVKPGKTSLSHMHHDAEIFVIMKGHGSVMSESKSKEVSEGDIIYFHPNTSHAITNHSQQEELLYFTIWWQNPSLYLKQEEADKTTSEEAPLYIFSASPTPNGNLHLGHLAGPYLAADVYKRYQKHLKGRAAYHLCGLDENQSYPAYLAKTKGVSVENVLNEFSLSIQNSLKLAGIECDSFIKPKESLDCPKILQNIFDRLVNDNILVKQKSDVLFCQNCQEYLHESFAKGNCPHCKNPASGGGCETCCLFYHEAELLEPCCAFCHEKPIIKNVDRWFFPLESYKEDLLRLHQQPSTYPLARTYAAKVLKNTLPNIPITHFGSWGEKIITSEGIHSPVYSYFEISVRYLAAKKDISHDTVGDMVQFLGIDNSFWRLILFPAMMFALREKDSLKHAIVNQFYELEHKKFSTSRNHVLSIEDLLSRYHLDIIRLYLCHSRPEVSPSNFSFNELDDFISREIKGQWLSLIEHLNLKLDAFSRIPPEPGLWSVYQKNFFIQLQGLQSTIQSFYEASSFSPKQASKHLCYLVQTACNFLEYEKDLNQELACDAYNKTSMALGLLALKLLAVLAKPIMPTFSDSLLKQLNVKSALLTPEAMLEWVSSNQPLPIFLFNFKDANYVRKQ